MKTRPQLLFIFRKDARHPERPGIITCRITVHGKSTNFSTGIRALRDDWSSEAHRLRGRSTAIKQANELLTKLEDSLNDLAADLNRQGRPITAKRLLYLYQKDGSSLSMLELYNEFLAERERLVGVEISASSFKLTKWRGTLLLNFLTAQRLTDLRPEEFSHNLGDKFIQWCLIEQGFTRTYSNKALQVFAQCLHWGVRREHLDRSPLSNYKYKTVARSEIKHLNPGELAALIGRSFAAEPLRKVRDCFVFQCYTGLAYADLKALNVAASAEYHKDITGVVRRVLRVRRQKSTMQKGFECIIPLLPEAERILSLYNDELPVPTNQVYNRYLKEVGVLCEIDPTKMTSHVGRKTAGVMMLNLGIRMETVSKFLGHSSVKMTEQVYAKLLDTTVVNEFSKLFGDSLPSVTNHGADTPPAQLGQEGTALPTNRHVIEQTTCWLRPAPVTSLQVASQQGGRVVEMWAEPTSPARKEAASA